MVSQRQHRQTTAWQLRSNMSSARDKKQVRLTVIDSEPLAHLAEQRLHQENIPCMVRSLGAGPGGWGVATNLPHAIYVRAEDEMRAREVLDLAPAEIAERQGHRQQPRSFSTVVVVLLIVASAALVLGMLELVFNNLFR